MILWWSSFKIVQRFKFHWELWLLRHQKGGKMSSPLNLTGRFKYNLVEMFLGWPSTKIVQAILIGRKKWQSGGISKGAKWQNLKIPFLAHQSTKCSRWVFVIAFCPSFVVRRQHLLVNTLVATFCIQSSWKFIRTYISIKSRPSSKLGHVGSQTRSDTRPNLRKILLTPLKPHFWLEYVEPLSECLS